MRKAATNFIVNEVESQFELHLEGTIAFLEFVSKENTVYLTHTSVPKDLERQGVGSQLVQNTLDHLKKTHREVLPLCSFVAYYIDNHPEYHSLLSEGYQM
ncbi:MAG TPA: GNAT family N-acetyltransferase [Flavobacterium sp.]|jgi:hypothetical protein